VPRSEGSTPKSTDAFRKAAGARDPVTGAANRFLGSAIRRFIWSNCAGVMPTRRNVPRAEPQQKDKTPSLKHGDSNPGPTGKHPSLGLG
jgi:hypothetical protein